MELLTCAALAAALEKKPPRADPKLPPLPESRDSKPEEPEGIDSGRADEDEDVVAFLFVVVGTKTLASTAMR